MTTELHGDDRLARPRDEADSLTRLLEHLELGRAQLSTHGPGRSCAVVVVDMQVRFLPDGDPASATAVAANARLVECARLANAPVFLVRTVYDRPEEIDPCWRARFGIFLERGDPTTELHRGIWHRHSDVIVEKKHASAFTGTSLHEQLASRGVDTVLLTGTSTSGCVRATAVEGAARHYRMAVVEECTYEPRPVFGSIALYEMAERYADELSLENAISVLG